MAIKIISWNINGLRSIIQKDNSLIKLIETDKPDIICLQEIKCTTRDIPKSFLNILESNNYILVTNCAKRKGYSGTAMIINKKYENDIINRTELYSKTIDINDEGRVIIVEFPNFILINVYVINSKPDLSRLRERIDIWEKNLRDILYTIYTTYSKEIVLVGDMNVAPEEIDIKNAKSNKGKHGFTNEERQSFKDLLQIKEVQLYDIFREIHKNTEKYSWFSHFRQCRQRNIGWRIDMFIVSRKIKENVIQTDILDKDTWYGSDHIPIVLEFTID